MLFKNRVVQRACVGFQGQAYVVLVALVVLALEMVRGQPPGC